MSAPPQFGKHGKDWQPPGGWESDEDAASWAKPTKADDAQARRDTKAADRAQRARYDAEPAPRTPAAAKRTQKAGGGGFLAPAGGGKTFSPTRSAAGAAGTGAGVLVGAIGAALGLAYLSYGSGGPRAWLAAKFLNRTGTAPAAATAGPSKSAVAGQATYGAPGGIYHGGI